jgi:hypothetical protein
VARRGRSTYLLPTLVRCDSPDHPLANREFLFPFASVVEVRPEEIPTRLGPTLAASVLTADQALLDRILASPLVHPAQTSARCRPGSSPGTSRTRATCSSISTCGALYSGGAGVA